MDLLVSFQVSSNGGTLILMGLPETQIPSGGQVDLSFCLGTAKKIQDKNFVVGAFHLIQFGKPIPQQAGTVAPPQVTIVSPKDGNYAECSEEKEKLKINKEEDSCPQPLWDDPKFPKNITRFIRTGPKSKFLYPEKMVLVAATQAKQICAELGFEPAFLETLADYLHIFEELITSNKKS